MSKARSGRPIDPQTERTRGRALLAEWLNQPDHTQTALAAEVQVSQVAVSQWEHGRYRPDAHLRTALERVTDGFVPADSWMTDRERLIAYPDSGATLPTASDDLDTAS